jgi:hypothetical protein
MGQCSETYFNGIVAERYMKTKHVELDRAANGANQKLPRRNVLGKHIYTSEKINY